MHTTLPHHRSCYPPIHARTIHFVHPIPCTLRIPNAPQVATSDSMRSKLDVLQRALAALGQLPEITGPGQQRQQGSSSGDGAVTWREFWRSEEWGRVVEAHTRLSDRGFATLGTQVCLCLRVRALKLHAPRPLSAQRRSLEAPTCPAAACESQTTAAICNPPHAGGCGGAAGVVHQLAAAGAGGGDRRVAGRQQQHHGGARRCARVRVLVRVQVRVCARRSRPRGPRVASVRGRAPAGVHSGSLGEPLNRRPLNDKINISSRLAPTP